MVTQTIPIRDFNLNEGTHWSWMQKLMLRRFQPQSIMIEVVSMIWFIYFFASHQWKTALLVMIMARVAEFLFVRAPNYDQFALTTWGKLALLHLHPVNYMVQLVGFLITCYGVWHYETLFLLIGISFVFLGHWFGWAKVNKIFATS